MIAAVSGWWGGWAAAGGTLCFSEFWRLLVAVVAHWVFGWLRKASSDVANLAGCKVLLGDRLFCGGCLCVFVLCLLLIGS